MAIPEVSPGEPAPFDLSDPLAPISQLVAQRVYQATFSPRQLLDEAGLLTGESVLAPEASLVYLLDQEVTPGGIASLTELESLLGTGGVETPLPQEITSDRLIKIAAGVKFHSLLQTLSLLYQLRRQFKVEQLEDRWVLEKFSRFSRLGPVEMGELRDYFTTSRAEALALLTAELRGLLPTHSNRQFNRIFELLYRHPEFWAFAPLSFTDVVERNRLRGRMHDVLSQWFSESNQRVWEYLHGEALVGQPFVGNLRLGHGLTDSERFHLLRRKWQEPAINLIGSRLATEYHGCLVRRLAGRVYPELSVILYFPHLEEIVGGEPVKGGIAMSLDLLGVSRDNQVFAVELKSFKAAMPPWQIACMQVAAELIQRRNVAFDPSNKAIVLPISGSEPKFNGVVYGMRLNAQSLAVEEVSLPAPEAQQAFLKVAGKLAARNHYLVGKG